MTELVQTQAISTLSQLLSAAGWHGSNRRIFEALPHMSEALSPQDIVQALENLKIPTTVIFGSPSELNPGDCPVLFIENDGTMKGILDVKADDVLITSSADEPPTWQPVGRARGSLVRLERFDMDQAEVTPAGFFAIARDFGSMLPWLCVASFLTNIMGLATPLLMMVVYDRVVPSGSEHLVLALGIAALITIGTDFLFRMARAKAVAYIGSETEKTLSLALVRKLLSLPLNQLEQTDVERQLARFKQFESLRDMFTGQVLSSILDLPFVFIFLGVLAWIAPPIALLIVVLAIIFVAAAIATVPKQQQLNQDASQDRAALQSLVFETSKQQQELQRLGLKHEWAARTAKMTQRAAASGRRARQFGSIGQALAQGLMALAGVGAIFISALGAMNGDMSFGALIAVMALVWKILNPVISLYSSAPQVLGYIQSKNQVDRVLKLPEEQTRGARQSYQRELRGDLSLINVTFRYSATGAIALSQVNLEIPSEEFVLLAGEANGGKSTLMSLIAGLYTPNVGAVQFDGVDIRQVAVDDLRQSVAFTQRHNELFYGTIFQNFKLAAPDISEEQTVQALQDMGLEEELAAMPEGIHTRLSEAFRATLPESTLRAMAMARSFTRNASVQMFNDPTSGLDGKRQAALLQCLERLKAEKKTVIVATQSPEIMQLADRYIFMQQGRIVADDHGSNGLKKVNALLERNRV